MSTSGSASNERPSELTDQRSGRFGRLGPTTIGLLTLMLLMLTAATGGSVSIQDTASQETPTVDLETVVSVAFVMFMLLGLVLFGAVVVVGRGQRRGRTPTTLKSQVFVVIAVTAVLAALIRLAPELLDRLRLIAEGLSTQAADESTPDVVGDGPNRLLPDLDARWLAALALLGGAIVFGLSRRRSAAPEPLPTKPSPPVIANPASEPAASRIDVELASIANDPNARRAIIAVELWLERRLAESGLPKDDCETPAEFLGTVARVRPGTASAARRFANRIDEAMFAPSAPTLVQRDEALQDARIIGDPGGFPPEASRIVQPTGATARSSDR